MSRKGIKNISPEQERLVLLFRNNTLYNNREIAKFLDFHRSSITKILVKFNQKREKLDIQVKTGYIECSSCIEKIPKKIAEKMGVIILENVENVKT